MNDHQISPPDPATYAKLPKQPNAPATRRIFGRRIKLIWGASRVIRGDWHLGLFGRYDRTRGDGWAISGRGLLLWGLGAAVVLYFGGASTIHVVRSRDPHNLASYSDILLWPLRVERMRELTGRTFIAQGLSDLKAQRHTEGLNRIRAGLRRYPEETEARRVLAQYFLRSGQRPLALRILNDRLDAGYPGRPFLSELFLFAAEGEDYAVILDACERYRAGPASPPAAADRPWLLQQQLQALLAARRADEALRLVEAEGAGAPAPVREARVLALVDLGRNDEAIAYLAAWRANPGGNLAFVLRLQVRAFREAGRPAEMDTAIQAVRALAPADPAPAVFGVVQCVLAGRDERAAAALDDYFFRFGGYAENLLLVARPLAEIGALPLVQRCFDRAASLGYDLKPFRLQLVLTLLHRGDWTMAQRALAPLRPVAGTGDVAEVFRFKWLEQLAAAAADPSPVAQQALLDVFQNRLLPLPVFFQTGTVLLRANRIETARRTLDLGQRFYPASSSLSRLQADRERVSKAGQ